VYWKPGRYEGRPRRLKSNGFSSRGMDGLGALAVCGNELTGLIHMAENLASGKIVVHTCPP